MNSLMAFSNGASLNNIFGSLSDPTRRDILKRVAKRALSVSQIAKAYKLTFAAISKHLMVLQKLNLWGPKNFTTKVDKMDFKVGGEWRFVHTDDKGNEFGFHGVYKEIVPNKKISDSFNFEGIPAGHELVETMVLEDLGNGKTKA